MIEDIKDVRDYIKRYVEFQEIKINAQAKLDILVAESNAIIASQERSKAAELEVKISNQRTYIRRLEDVINKWGNALASLSATYNKTEYEMFNTLIIRGVPPKKTKWAQQTCYNFRNQVFKDIAKLTKKEGI